MVSKFGKNSQEIYELDTDNIGVSAFVGTANATFTGTVNVQL